MRKQFKRIIKAVCLYRKGLLEIDAKDITSEQVKVSFDRYHFYFYWPIGKLYGTFEVITVDKITVFELSHASDYTKYEDVEKRLIRLIFTSNTDNHCYILRVIEEVLFPSI